MAVTCIQMLFKTDYYHKESNTFKGLKLNTEETKSMCIAYMCENIWVDSYQKCSGQSEEVLLKGCFHWK